MFQIRQIEAQADNIEYLGTTRKFWFTEGGTRFLFKTEERGTGEDWAEKVVCDLAELIGLPHVTYELAKQSDGAIPGVICPNFAPRPRELVMGNQLLFQSDSNYPANLQKKFGVRKYTVEAVRNVMGLLQPPSAEWRERSPPAVVTSCGFFAGYLMLDAWVANQDRHHQNWGAILDGGRLFLAPTYDHGSALARNLLDAERAERMATKDTKRTVEYFATRARSEFYPAMGDRTLPMVELFQQFAAPCHAEASAWLDRLRAVKPAQMDAILEQVPVARMSQVTRHFTLELLTINQRRILAG